MVGSVCAVWLVVFVICFDVQITAIAFWVITYFVLEFHGGLRHHIYTAHLTRRFYEYGSRMCGQRSFQNNDYDYIIAIYFTRFSSGFLSVVGKKRENVSWLVI